MMTTVLTRACYFFSQDKIIVQCVVPEMINSLTCMLNVIEHYGHHLLSHTHTIYGQWYFCESHSIDSRNRYLQNNNM